MSLRLPRFYTALKPLLAILAAVGLYALAGGVGLPWLLHRQLAQWTARHPGFGAGIQRIRFDPFAAKLGFEQLDFTAAGTGAPLRLHVDELQTDIAVWSSLRGRRLEFGDIRIVAPSLEAGDFTALAGLFGHSGGGAAAIPVRIGRLTLERGHWRQRSAAAVDSFSWQLDDIAFQLEHYTSDGTEPSALTLEAKAAPSAKLAAHASLSLAPLALDAAVQLDGLPLPPLWRRYLALPALELKQGSASLDTPIHYRSGTGVVVGPGTLRLNRLELVDSERQTALLRAPAVELRRVKLDWGKQRAECAAITADHAQVAAWLEENGRWNYARFVQDAPDNTTEPAWHYRIGGIALKNSELNLQDLSHPNAPALALAPLSLEVAALGNNNDASPLQLKLDTAVNGQGRLHLDLSGKDQQGRLGADIEAEQIPLVPLNPYLQALTKVSLHQGDLDLTGHLDYQAGEEAPLRFAGNAAIQRLAVARLDDEQALLSWRRLFLKELNLAYPGGPLHVAEIVAEQPYARIAIEADQTLNWAKLAVQSGSPAPQPDPAMPITIDALRIRNGVADFADHTLQPDFAATIRQLDGAIKDLSSNSNARAALLLEGKVDQYAPVRVQGIINPFRAGAYTDIEMHFHNMDLTRLSPYSGKFAGYRIDKGKLTLDLRYRLENRKLEAENLVVMDHLTLGERVQSKSATTLPIGLAIALLRDADGKIDIHLPISGNLDDPRFSLRGLYAQAITGLITKLIASPFTVLGNVLEGDPEEYGRVAFFPGKALLSARQKEKLLKLADALRQRSGLNLEIRGVADPERDRAALAETRLQEHIRRHWLDELRAKGETVDFERKHAPIPEADYRRLLLAQYATSGLGIAADAEQARQALLEKFAANDTDLRLLAQRRAERIREFLTQDGGIEERRVFLLDVLVESQPGRELETVLLLNGS